MRATAAQQNLVMSVELTTMASKDLEETTKFLLKVFGDYDLRHLTRKQINKHVKGAYGVTDTNAKKIYIAKDMSGIDCERVLLHEVAHVYMDDLLRREKTEEEVWDLAYKWMRAIYKG